MTLADKLLIVWWVLLAVTFLGLFAFVWASWLNPTVIPAPQTIWFFVCLLVLCVIGLFVSFWMAHWSALFLLNSFICMMLLGAAILATGLFTRRSQWMRALMITFGAACIGIGMNVVVGDFLGARLPVDGCVTRLTHYTSFRRRDFGDYFAITIGDTTYKTTHTVFSGAHKGDYVRANLGQTSKTVLEIAKIADSNCT